jgi:hypothetical protein
MRSLCLTQQVSASHDKSPHRTRSLCLTRQVSVSHDKSLPSTRSLAPASSTRSGSAADAEELRAQKASTRGKRRWEGKVPNQRPTHGFKGANTAPHLRRPARRVSGTFAHMLACPGETTARSRDALVPAEYGPATSACCHDGTVKSITSAEKPAPITAPTFTTIAISAPTKRRRATTATITNKSSRASLQLTHEIGGYIRLMHSRAPAEDVKNALNTKIIQLSLSATP